MKKRIAALAAAAMGFLAGAGVSIGQKAANPGILLPFMDEAEYWGFMDRAAKVVIPADYIEVRGFSEGIARVLDDRGGPFYIDATNKIIWPAPAMILDRDYAQVLIDELGPFCDGLACVTEKGRFGFIDRTGKYAIQPRFLSAGNFSEGLAWAKTAEGFGFIRQDGVFAVKPQYKSARSFSGGLAPVMLGEKWGYIDKTGAVVIKIQYDKAGGFSEGLASFGVRNPGEIKGTGMLAEVRDNYNFAGSSIGNRKCGYRPDNSGTIFKSSRTKRIWR